MNIRVDGSKYVGAGRRWRSPGFCSPRRRWPPTDVKSYTRATFDEWVKKYQDAEPTFKPGDVITQKDLDKLRPFIPPGYIEQLDFPDFRAEIGAPGDYSQHKDFIQCTEQYQSQVALEANGALKNYVCGQPFAVTKLKVEDAGGLGSQGGLELQLPLAELRSGDHATSAGSGTASTAARTGRSP